MSRKIPRFISITGFMAHAQVVEMERAFRAAGGPASGLRLGVGVMTGRTLRARKRTRLDRIFPPVGEIPKIFASLPDESPGSARGPFRVLHWVDHNRLDRQGAIGHLIDAVGEAKPGINALQLDMVWPQVAELEQLRRAHPDIPVILQVGRRAMQELSEEARPSGLTAPDRLAARIARYQGPLPLLAGVLLDRSEGEGILLDGRLLAEEAAALRLRFRDLALVAAGGLGPDTVDALDPVLARDPDLSIDAQAGLCVNHNILYPVDWERAAAYLRVGVAKFRVLEGRRER